MSGVKRQFIPSCKYYKVEGRSLLWKVKIIYTSCHVSKTLLLSDLTPLGGD